MYQMTHYQRERTQSRRSRNLAIIPIGQPVTLSQAQKPVSTDCTNSQLLLPARCGITVEQVADVVYSANTNQKVYDISRWPEISARLKKEAEDRQRELDAVKVAHETSKRDFMVFMKESSERQRIALEELRKANEPFTVEAKAVSK